MIYTIGTRDAGNGRSVWAYTDAGVLSWTYDTGGTTVGVLTDSANNVYVIGAAADNGDGNGTRNCWKLNSTGGYIVGAQVLSANNANGIDLDANYVYVSTDSGCARLDRNFQSSTTITVGARVAIRVDSSSNIYVGGAGAYTQLTKYNANLVSQWTEDSGSDGFISLAVLSDGDVIVGTNDGEIRKYKSDGSSAGSGTWAVVVDGASQIRVAVDSSDAIYGVRLNEASGSNKRFICLDTDGAEQWSITTASGDLEGVMVTSDDEVYVCGDAISSYDIWQVDLTEYTLIEVVLSGSSPLLGITGEGASGAGGSGSVAPVDKTYSKNLVAIANGQVYYEATAGTMSAFSAAVLDTTEPLTAVSAYESLFIANKGKLKVFDLVTVKLNTADAGAVACVRGTILTGSSSGASAVVQYVDAVTDDAAMNVFARRTTMATFTAEAVTGDGGQGFTLSAVETAGPHWYNWTSFGNDTTTYGTMPTQAYIIAVYRGRLVLAGHKDYPHMWWMSSAENPFDWLYDENDLLSAVKGNNTEAAQIGDIIRALIPNGDDFLLFCCANSIWICRGDPIEGGSIDKIDDTIGIYSPWSWCQDSERNSYFFGTGGFWKIDNEGNNLQNLSFHKIPSWVDDWALDPALHRVTVAYDPQRHGILISKITLSDGTNEGYFYSLITEGFYPESYPAEAAPYSAVYYEADDPAYKHLVLGGTDGYLRYFKDTAKDDDAGASGDTAINSYFTLAPKKLAEGDNQEGIAKNFNFVVAGGRSGGGYTDSDGFSYEFHVADDAETLAEDVIDGATARESGSFTTTGRQYRVRKRVRGLWFTCKCYNSTANKSWAMNKLTFHIKPVGNK